MRWSERDIVRNAIGLNVFKRDQISKTLLPIMAKNHEFVNKINDMSYH